MDATEIITISIALWGAILSTILAVREIMKGRRKVKVKCNPAVTEDRYGQTIYLVQVKAVNAGYRPITIANGGLLISDGRTFTQLVSKLGPNKLPYRLEDGESLSLYFDLDAAKEVGTKLAEQGFKLTGAFVQDTEGKRYITEFSREESDYLAGLSESTY